MKHLYAVVIATLITGCGGGPDPYFEPKPTATASPAPATEQQPPSATSSAPAPATQTPPPSTTPPVVTPPPVIVTPPPVPPPTESVPEPEPAYSVGYYGDSIIWGWNGAEQEGPNGWPRVQNPAPAVFAAATGVPTENLGWPGYLAEHALAGEPPYDPWATIMSRSTATHVIVEYHSHDTTDQTTQRLRQIIQIARSYNKRVVIETIGPGNHSGNLTWTQISDAQRAAATAELVPVIDQTQFLESWMTNNGAGLWDICPDGLHPNQATYTLKGQYAASQWSRVK